MRRENSLQSTLAGNTVWLASGSAFSQGLSLLTAVVVARILGVSRFGELALIQSTVTMIGTFGELGATLTTTKFTSSWRTSDPKRAGRVIGLSFLTTAASGVALSLLLLALQSRFRFPVFPGLSREMEAACGLLLFDMLNRIQFGVLAGLEAFSASTKIQFARGLLTLPLVWLGAERGGLLGTVVAFGSVSLIVFAIGHAVVRRQCRSLSIPLSFRGGVQAEVIGTSLSLWISSLLLTGSTWVVTVLLSEHPGGLSQLGLYNAADKLKTALLFLPQMLFQVTLPMLSHHRSEGNSLACRHIVTLTFAAAVIVTGLAAAVVLAFAKPLMSSYGSAFVAGADVLSLAALASVVMAIYTVGSGALWALGRPTDMLRIDLSKTLLLFVFCFLGLATTASRLMLAHLLTFGAGGAVVSAAVYRQLGYSRK